ncbi:auxin-induced protein 10A5 [Tripterygium wilfordii]|uniref:Auxin-induced protein 10A5 n=1 Tax=Tripterygium wilfordii TaxID=458696 RepID=A0A7J7DLM2_TRIWF|nr:auxin-induced protein 10A5 [Tripterygium wilfordii]
MINIRSIARKWQKMAGIRDGKKNRTISFPQSRVFNNPSKGHFVVYSSDNRRFVVPLGYLKSFIFRELFKRSEEEFGLPSNGPITLPCDSTFMEYVVCLLDWKVSQELEKALLLSLDSAGNYCFQGLINWNQICVHGI